MSASNVGETVPRFIKIAKGGWRYSVHRIGTDEAIHVHCVRIVRVFGAGAGPQRSLDPGPLRCQSLPAPTTTDLAEAGVGDFGIGNRDLALQVVVAEVLELLVHGGVHATDKEGGDRSDPGQVAAGSCQLFQAG